MIIIVYSETTERNIQEKLGFSEYSYYFVLKEFLPALQEIGIVVRVTDPATEVDAIYRSAVREGQDCIFLSFTPPHQTVLGLECPTIPIFAWEFDRIPDESWGDEPRNDWRYVLERTGRAITHSRFAADTVRASMGPDYPVAAIPAPVWDRFATLAERLRRLPRQEDATFDLVGKVIDTRDIDIFAYSPQRIPDPRTEPWPHERPKGPVSVTIPAGGVVYTSIFNPYDGRKNSFDMICGFCWALRDREDATLVVKLTYNDPTVVLGLMIEDLYKLTPYKCRVLLVHAFLDDSDYERLTAITTYALNTSHGEGQCLPLMEYMSCGKPAVAPRHTSMIDYIDDTNAFIIDSSREPSFWPHDPRCAYRTFRHRISFESLVAAFRESYRVAKEEPQRYARMSESAAAALERHCSKDAVIDRLRTVLDHAPEGAAARPRRVAQLS